MQRSKTRRMPTAMFDDPPDSFKALEDGQSLDFGNWPWQTRIAAGHTPKGGSSPERKPDALPTRMRLPYALKGNSEYFHGI